LIRQGPPLTTNWTVGAEKKVPIATDASRTVVPLRGPARRDERLGTQRREREEACTGVFVDDSVRDRCGFTADSYCWQCPLVVASRAMSVVNCFV
jgi:hypothetical protein